MMPSEEALREYKAQRAAQLEREVSLMARMPNTSSLLSGQTAALWKRGHRNLYAPPPACNHLKALVTRTASNTSSHGMHSCPGSTNLSAVPGRTLSQDFDDAIDGLISSPMLRGAVDVLATPDLVGIALDLKQQQANLPSSSFTLNGPSRDLDKQDTMERDKPHKLPSLPDVSITPPSSTFFESSPRMAGAIDFWKDQHGDNTLRRDPSCDEATLILDLAASPEASKRSIFEEPQSEVKPALKSEASPTRGMKRTGSMLQVSHELLKLSRQGAGGLPRRPSLTCMDLLSGR